MNLMFGSSEMLTVASIGGTIGKKRKKFCPKVLFIVGIDNKYIFKLYF